MENNFKATISKGLIKLAFQDHNFTLEPCRPGYYNLINEKTNLVVQVVPMDMKIPDLLEICFKELNGQEKQ